MTYTRLRLGLVLAGGTTLDPRDRRIDTVRTAADVPRWFSRLGELQMIGDVEPVFVYAAPTQGTPDEWRLLHQKIRTLLPTVDGICVLHELATLPLAAAATAFAFPHPGKPIIFSSSPFGVQAPLGAKRIARTLASSQANILNAIQAATSGVGGVMVTWGNQLLPATRIMLEWGEYPRLKSPEPQPLAKIDFGVRWVHAKPPRRPTQRVKALPQFAGPILSLPASIHSPELIHNLQPTAFAGLLITLGTERYVPPVLKALADRARQAGRPVGLVMNKRPRTVPAGYVVIAGLTPVAAQVKFQWAVAQTTSVRALQQLLDRPIVGEFGGGV